jgi:D-amino-acid dehydrogenase
LNQERTADIAVIGGGIIGLCVAERLIHEGFSVTVIERERIAAGASAGNAAGFAFSEIMPMASSATIRKAVKWLVDPTGPFSVVPQDLHKTISWLVKFAAASRNSVFDQSLKTLAAMMQLERQTLPDMLTRTGLESMVRESGALYLYETKAKLSQELRNWNLRDRNGVSFECFEGAALHQFQEGLSKRIEAGVHVPYYKSVSDPKDYCIALHEVIESKGVETRYETVGNLVLTPDGAVIHTEEGAALKAEKVVVAAGPWSSEVIAPLGDKVPLIGERGYNTTFPKSAFPSLERPLFFTAHGFVMSPLINGIRVGGASEISRLGREPNYERSRAMLRVAKTFVPDLHAADGVEWMGTRPTTPDTLPVIGHATNSPNVVYAFGHGHLGLSLATSTAKLVADLICDRRVSLDINTLGPQRF